MTTADLIAELMKLPPASAPVLSDSHGGFLQVDRVTLRAGFPRTVGGFEWFEPEPPGTENCLAAPIVVLAPKQYLSEAT